MDTNLFSPPEVKHTTLDSAEMLTYPEAKNGKRFLTLLIDVVMYYALSIIFGIIVGIYLVSTDGNTDRLESMDLMLNLIGLGIYCLYYTLMEGLFGLTIGKLVTGTRVVDNATHAKPSLPRVLLRSLCRLLPFEPFSFFGSKPGGWHDHLSNTRTIDKRATPITVAEYEEMRDLRI